jgi:hypothetical protein
VRKAAPRSKRARLFGRCLGLLEPVVPPAGAVQIVGSVVSLAIHWWQLCAVQCTPAEAFDHETHICLDHNILHSQLCNSAALCCAACTGVGALLHFMAQLHCACGPLTGEATEGSSQVMARTALQLAAEVLQPTLAPACLELAALPDALVTAAGGSSDNTLEVDDALELLLAAWLAQRAADQQQLEMLVWMVDSKGRGLAVQDEFAALLKQASRHAQLCTLPCLLSLVC